MILKTNALKVPKNIWPCKKGLFLKNTLAYRDKASVTKKKVGLFHIGEVMPAKTLATTSWAELAFTTWAAQQH